MSDEAQNLRVVDAIERVWKSVLAIRDFADQFILFQSVLLPSEYDHVTSGNGRKTAPQMNQQEFYSRVGAISSEVEIVRPLVGETIWLLYNIYNIFAIRQAAKVQEGLEKGKLYAWNCDVEGKPDSAIQRLLGYIFTEQELSELTASDGLGITARIMGIIETKILNEMNDLIFNRDFHKPDLEKQQSILNSIALIHRAEIEMGDKYITGQAGAVGLGPHVRDMTFNQIWAQIEGTIDLSHLAEELAILRQAMKNEATGPEHDVAIGAVAAAEQAAKTGNGPKALGFLKTAGKWSLDMAEKVGVGVSIAALRSALGV